MKNRMKISYFALWSLLFMTVFSISTFADDSDPFLPGGAWEEDKGIIIKEGTFEYDSPVFDLSDEECLSVEKAGSDPYFDPRDEGLVSEVKDQYDLALCWDFAAVSTAESALIKKGYDKSIDLSEYHGAAFTYLRQKAAGCLSETESFMDFCNGGGNPLYIWALWQEGYGPELEGDFPGVDTISQNSVPPDLEAGGICTLSSVRSLGNDLEEIKDAIRQSGAVTGLYYSYGLYYNDGVNEKKDSSYYMPYPVKIRNHAISIVGWDDDFPAGSFVNDFIKTKSGNEPLPNGAWLVKNSWGKRAYKSSDEASGYYWISYYDQSLSDFTAISFVEDEAGDPEDEVIEDKDDPDLKEDTVNPEIDEIDDPDEQNIEDISCFKHEDKNAGKLTKAPTREGSVKKEKKLREKNIKIKGIIYTIKDGKAAVKSARSKKRKVKIPASIKYKGKKYPVTKIGKKAFVGNRYVKKIILGKNIRSIGKDAFKGCRNLRVIRFQTGEALKKGI